MLPGFVHAVTGVVLFRSLFTEGKVSGNGVPGGLPLNVRVFPGLSLRD